MSVGRGWGRGLKLLQTDEFGREQQNKGCLPRAFGNGGGESATCRLSVVLQHCGQRPQGVEKGGVCDVRCSFSLCGCESKMREVQSNQTDYHPFIYPSVFCSQFFGTKPGGRLNSSINYNSNFHCREKGRSSRLMKLMGTSLAVY